jgi:lipopolysaccharide/colanic/teichoic acid biosynthesis glycosyltransferase
MEYGERSVGWDRLGEATGVLAFASDQRGKRAFDIVLASMILTLLSPILLITAVAIKLDSRGPVLIRATLYGYGNRAIEVFKFRSRKICVANRTTTHFSWIGRILRRTGIDELPQLFNVMRGEISIVGPRPYVSQQDFFDHRISHCLPLLYSVKPGMICWTQNRASREDTRIADQRVDEDLHYAANWSLFLDLKIIVKACFQRCE